jgi:hypothetical protein
MAGTKINLSRDVGTDAFGANGTGNDEGPRSTEPYSQIRQKHGAPAFWDKKAEAMLRINEPFWAAVFAQENIIIHEYLEQGFYLYNQDSGLYVPESHDEVRTKLAATLLRASRQWTSLKGIEKFQASQSLRGVIEHLQGQVKRRNFFDNTEPLVHVANCVLRIKADSFSSEAFSPTHRSRNRSPIAYDAKAQCPRFKNELLAPLDDDDKELIQKYSGQLLLGSIRPNEFCCWRGKLEPGKRRLRLSSKILWAPKTSRASAPNISKSASRLEGSWIKRCFWALT